DHGCCCENQRPDGGGLGCINHIVARDHQPGKDVEMRLEWFMKQKPPTFTGGYNPDGAYK
ncbi:hypothetical protein A2U01_0106501, partial [Trifolium medium]|nr:hypothetical protein [Trifolium medium]